MEKIFNTLIDGFIDHKVGIANDFLSVSLAGHLKANLNSLYQSQLMLAAGTGNAAAVVHDQLVRSDKIYWLDRKHHDRYEDDFFDLMDRFVLHLNNSCYAGIVGYEFHYALYEAGSFYKRHLDQFQHNGKRAYSMIMYLNTAWQEGDGGELCIHHETGVQHITPINGKSVFFKSTELEHEVLLSHQPRMSITGWLLV